MPNKKWSISTHVDYLNVWSDYIMKGRILILPIEGTGKANVTFGRLQKILLRIFLNNISVYF